jgi:heterodisulfide reductase subunit D
MSPSVLQAYMAEETQALWEQCTACGTCVEVCPMPPDGHLPGADPQPVVSGVLGMVRGGRGRDGARRWAQVCTASGACVPACPEGVHPRKMLHLAKHTLKRRERVPQPAGATSFTRTAQSIRPLVATQMRPCQVNG